MQTNIQTTNYLYPTTNTSLLTTHHALVVCEAVRRVCPCDDDRDAKEGDCDSDVSTSDQFSWKQLRNATIVVLGRQKPSTNALGGLYLPWMDRMLDARWVEGCAVSLLRRTCVWWKSRQGLPFTHDGVGFTPCRGGDILSIPSLWCHGRAVWSEFRFSLNFWRWYGSPV